MSNIEEERDEWLEEQGYGARITHTLESGRHKVELSSQDPERAEQTEDGTGKTYGEALLVALRNWQSRYGEYR